MTTGVILVLVLVAAGAVGIYFLAGSCSKQEERKQIPVTSQVTIVSADNKFTKTIANGQTTFAFNLSSANATAYSYSHLTATLPNSCYRYDEIYIKFSVQKVSQIVFKIGSDIYKANNLEDTVDNVISFKITDWGYEPIMLVFIDTYSDVLSSRDYANNKSVTFTEIGFYEPDRGGN